MASPIRSTFFPSPPQTPLPRSLVELVGEDLARGEYVRAYDNLFFLLRGDVKAEDLETVYGYIFKLFDKKHVRDISALEERLTIGSFLSKSSHLIEEQRHLALCLGHTLLCIGISQEKTYFQAMEYYVTSWHLTSDLEKQREGHQGASLVFLHACLGLNSFKEQLIEALEREESFRHLLDRLNDLGRKFCCSLSDIEIMRKFYGCVRDEINSLRLKGDPYKKYRTLIEEGLLHPSYTERGLYPTERYKAHLDAVRELFRQLPGTVEGVRRFQAEVAQAFRLFFEKLIEDLHLLLGPPPCPYELRAMGSLGREEPCPFSDIEFFLLLEIKNDKTIAYFKRFIHFLDLQLRSLGEKKTILISFPGACFRKGMEIDNGGNPATCEGLLGTPSDCALLQSKEIFLKPGQEDEEIVRDPTQTMLASTHLVPAENSRLFKGYEEELVKLLQQNKEGLPLFQYKALKYLQSRVRTFASKAWPRVYSVGKEINIKEQYLAPLYYPFIHMGLYWEIKETNIFDILDSLSTKESPVFTKSTLKLIKESIADIYTIRSALHLRPIEEILNEKDTLILESGDFNSKKLEKIYWCVLRPLYRVLAQALSCGANQSPTKQFETILNNLNLIDVIFEEACASAEKQQFIPGIRQAILHLITEDDSQAELVRYFELLSQDPSNESLCVDFIRIIQKESPYDFLKRLLYRSNSMRVSGPPVRNGEADQRFFEKLDPKKLQGLIEQQKKQELQQLRKRAPQNYPAYFDELIENGYIALYDHLIHMRTFPSREARGNEIRKMMFSSLSHVVLETREAVIQKVKSSIPPDRRNILFLLGVSGAGKSTALCFLRGDKMVLKGSCYESHADKSRLIGHEGETSCTFLPNISTAGDLTIVDFPGFEDTHGQIVSLGFEFAFKALIKEYHPKILVLESITNTEGRLAGAGRLGSRLSRLLDNKEDCILGITKYSKDVDFVKLKSLEERQKLERLAPTSEEHALSIASDLLINDIKQLSSLNVEAVVPLIQQKQQQLQEKQEQIARIKQERLIELQLALPDTDEKTEIKKRIKTQEDELLKQIGLRKIIQFCDLEEMNQLSSCLATFNRLTDGISIHVRAQQALDPADKELLENRFRNNLMEELDVKKDYNSCFKEFKEFEQSVVEFSLIKTIYSHSNPEIGQLLHLPEIDPTIVREYDKEIVEKCTHEYAVSVLRTLDISLINKILKEIGANVSPIKVAKIKKSLAELQKHITNLLGRELNDPDQTNREWERIQKQYETEANALEERFRVPTWILIALSLLVIPQGIFALYKWGIGRSVKQGLDEKIIDRCCENLDEMLNTLLRLKDIKIIVQKQKEIDAAFHSAPISMKSVDSLNASIQRRIDKVKNIYGNTEWEERVAFLADTVLFTHFDPKKSAHILPAYAYYLIEPGLSCVSKEITVEEAREEEVKTRIEASTSAPARLDAVRTAKNRAKESAEAREQEARRAYEAAIKARQKVAIEEQEARRAQEDLTKVRQKAAETDQETKTLTGADQEAKTVIREEVKAKEKALAEEAKVATFAKAEALRNISELIKEIEEEAKVATLAKAEALRNVSELTKEIEERKRAFQTVKLSLEIAELRLESLIREKEKKAETMGAAVSALGEAEARALSVASSEAWKNKMRLLRAAEEGVKLVRAEIIEKTAALEKTKTALEKAVSSADLLTRREARALALAKAKAEEARALAKAKEEEAKALAKAKEEEANALLRAKLEKERVLIRATAGVARAEAAAAAAEKRAKIEEETAQAAADAWKEAVALLESTKKEEIMAIAAVEEAQIAAKAAAARTKVAEKEGSIFNLIICKESDCRNMEMEKGKLLRLSSRIIEKPEIFLEGDMIEILGLGHAPGLDKEIKQPHYKHLPLVCALSAAAILEAGKKLESKQ